MYVIFCVLLSFAFQQQHLQQQNNLLKFMKRLNQEIIYVIRKTIEQ